VSIFQKSNSKMSARRQINIRSVDGDILALPDDEYRVVLQTSTINLELKSEAEQDVLIDNYQSFLNALSCPIQILIRVREINLDKYTENFEKRITKSDSEIYKKQALGYSEFIKQLVATNKILARDFYIVIPFKSKDSEARELIEESLNLNAEIISKGLSRLGMRTRKLSGLEILDLFYSFYCPDQSKSQPITDQTLTLLKKAYI
jgi:hypothetical protein